MYLINVVNLTKDIRNKILKIYLCLLILSIGVHHILLAQISPQEQKAIDSLKNLYQKEEKQEQKLYLLYKIGDSFQNVYVYDSVRLIAIKGLYKSQMTKNAKLETSFLYLLGRYHNAKYQYDSSLFYLRKALSLAKTGTDKKLLAVVNFQFGVAYAYIGYYSISVDYLIEARKIFTEMGDKQGLAEVLMSICTTLISHKNYPQALAIGLESLALQKQFNNPRVTAVALNNIGWVYECLKDYANAQKYYQESVDLCKKIGDEATMEYALDGLTQIYIFKGDYQTAFSYAYKCLEINQKTKDKYAAIWQLPKLAFLYEKLGYHEKAIETALKAELLGKELNNWENLEAIYKELIKFYQSEQNYPKVIEYYRLYATAKDSVFNIESARAVANLQYDYQLQQQKEQLKLLKTENELKKAETQKQQGFLITSFIFTLFLSGFIIFLLRNNQKEKKINALLNKQSQEITEQAENLQRLNEDKNKLLSIISHDLRSPIGNLKSLLSLFGQGGISQDEFKIFSNHLHTNVDSLHQNLENLLQWSYSQMEGIKVNPRLFDVTMVVEEQVNFFSENLSNKNVSIKSTLPKPTFVYADENHISIVIRNLVSNAIKFSNKGGEIVISAQICTDKIAIGVKDTGLGMDSQKLSKLFRNDAHFTERGTAGEKGTGLGLTLSKEFVEKNGGKIWVESEEGNGSTFYFNLPRNVE